MSKQREQNNEFFNELKVKGMTDYCGHYVEMKQIDKDGRVWWIWNDGAITNQNFKRDLLFNFLYSIIKFYRLNKLTIKLLSFCLLTALILILIF